MKTALEILNEKHLLVDDGRTCEAHTRLVIDAMEEYAKLYHEEKTKISDLNATAAVKYIELSKVIEAAKKNMQDNIAIGMENIMIFLNSK